jgi:hypothetical protein
MGAMTQTKILFPAIDLKDGPTRRPQRLAREDVQTEKGIGHV